MLLCRENENVSYDLSAISDNLGYWQLGISLNAGERRKLDMKLKETISISGTVLALENKTPMANALIQAVAVDSMPKLIFAALSDKEGKYQIENMKPGRYQVWCRIPGGEVYYGEKKNTPPVLQIECGKTLKDINFRFIYLEKQFQRKVQLPSSASSRAMASLKPFFEEQAYTPRVGAESMRSAVIDAQGYTWFNLVARNIEPPFRRFDGKRFTEVENTTGGVMLTFPNYARDADGKVWIAGSKGVARLWNGKVEKYFTVQDGLPSNTIRGIMADKTGGIWISTGTGISCIHKENGIDKISPVVDSSGVPYMKVDSENGLWWIENPGIDSFDNITAFRDGSVYLKKGNKLYRWTPEGLRQITTENSLPDGEIEKVWKSSTKLFFRVAGQIGWIENGNISLVDTNRYPELKNMANVQQDNKGRLFFYGYPDEVNIREIWMLEGEKLTKLLLPEPTNGELIFGDDEVVLIGYNSKIYRYSQEHQQFYTLMNTGDLIGYIWDVYITNGNLVASWGKYFIGGISLLIAGIFGVQRCRLSHAEKLRLQHELEDARQMQIRLLPESAPMLQGFDIAGFSRPAREVGGDFFDYLSLGDGKIGIALADASGKGMKAAMNIVLTSGILSEVAVIEGTPGRSLSRLNADLYPRIEKLMFIALGFGILDSTARMLQWSNAAQPCPMVKRGEEVFEFKNVGQLPLGMMPEIAYPDWELELQPGDIVIFYTDGIIEAENEGEEMYSTERLEQIVTNMNSTMKAEEVIEIILKDVTGFVGDMEQYDDMTIVVVKKL